MRTKSTFAAIVGVAATKEQVHGWIHRQMLTPPHKIHRTNQPIMKHINRCSRVDNTIKVFASHDNEEEKDALNGGLTNNSNLEADRDNNDKQVLNDIFKGTSNPEQRQQRNQQKEPRSTFDSFLDKPYFDPDDYDENDDSFFGKIASFVKRDYELFEALFVSSFFLILITITKDILRAQMDSASSMF